VSWLVYNEIFILLLQAVRSGTVPTSIIPTDEHLKVFSKKTEKPEKSEIVAARIAHRRF